MSEEELAVKRLLELGAALLDKGYESLANACTESARVITDLERENADLRAKLAEADQRHAAVMLHTQGIVDEANALRTRAEEAERKLSEIALDTTWQDHADHWQKRAMEAERKLAETEITRLNNDLFVEQWHRLGDILGVGRLSVIQTIDVVQAKLADAEQRGADAARREATGICGGLEEFYWRKYKSDDPSSHTEGKSDGAQACATAILARIGQPAKGAEEDSYLMGSCTESECQLCRTPKYARKPGMHHAGLTAGDKP